MRGQPISLDDYRRLVGTSLGASTWLDVQQPQVDAFAKITGDCQFIHVDPVAAASTSFGGTIAHGFLTLSLLSRMGLEVLPQLQGTAMSVNYGFNAVRFLQPVRVGARVRGVFSLDALHERESGSWQSVMGVTVEIEAEAKPALVAQWLVLTVLAHT